MPPAPLRHHASHRPPPGQANRSSLRQPGPKAGRARVSPNRLRRRRQRWRKAGPEHRHCRHRQDSRAPAATGMRLPRWLQPHAPSAAAWPDRGHPRTTLATARITGCDNVEPQIVQHPQHTAPARCDPAPAGSPRPRRAMWYRESEDGGADRWKAWAVGDASCTSIAGHGGDVAVTAGGIPGTSPIGTRPFQNESF